MTKIQKDGHSKMKRIDYLCPISSCNSNQAQEMLTYKEQKRKRPFPWKADLEIGPDIQIPTTGYIATRRETAKTWKRSLTSEAAVAATSRHIFPDNPELKPETVLVRDNEDQETIEPTEIISAYKYGSAIVPMGDILLTSGYEGGPKSLTLLGFVRTECLDISQLTGNGTMIFQPTEGNDYSISAMSALVKAMLAEGVAAIVRKVYRKGLVPRLGVLIPEVDKQRQ